MPFLIAEALASNIGGTATLVGDPPNLIVASRSGLTFNDFLINLGPIVVVMLIAFVGLSRFLFRRTSPPTPIRWPRSWSSTNGRRSATRSSSSAAWSSWPSCSPPSPCTAVLHLEPSVVALLGAGLLVAISRLSPQTYLDDVEWETLLFFAGLFLLVGALVKTGAINHLASALAATGDSMPRA